MLQKYYIAEKILTDLKICSIKIYVTNEKYWRKLDMENNKKSQVIGLTVMMTLVAIVACIVYLVCTLF